MVNVPGFHACQVVGNGISSINSKFIEILEILKNSVGFGACVFRSSSARYISVSSRHLFTCQVFVGASKAILRKRKTTKKIEDHMGEDPGLWYSNWHHASLVARQLLQEVEALADGSEGSGRSEVMPRPLWRVGGDHF